MLYCSITANMPYLHIGINPIYQALSQYFGEPLTTGGHVLSIKNYLIPLIIVSAALAILSEQLGHFNSFVLLKPLTTVLVIMLLCVRNEFQLPSYAKLILIGLVFCLLGDSLLLFEQFFVPGLSAFLLGHLIFLRAFSSLGGFKFRALPLLLISMATVAIYLWLLPELGDTRIPVGVYMVVLGTMVWQGICLWLWNPNPFTKMVAFAAILFMISDTIIAVNKFIAPSDYASVAILITYWFSIGFLAYSSNLSGVTARSS